MTALCNEKMVAKYAHAQRTHVYLLKRNSPKQDLKKPNLVGLLGVNLSPNEATILPQITTKWHHYQKKEGE